MNLKNKCFFYIKSVKIIQLQQKLSYLKIKRKFKRDTTTEINTMLLISKHFQMSSWKAFMGLRFYRISSGMRLCRQNLSTILCYSYFHKEERKKKKPTEL